MEQKRLLLALALSFGIIFAWDRFYLAPRRPLAPTGPVSTQTTPSATDAQGGTKQAPAVLDLGAVSNVPVEKRTLETDLGSITLSNEASFFSAWDLKKYTGAADRKIDLKEVLFRGGAGEIAFDSPELAYLAHVRGRIFERDGSAVWSYSDSKIALERVYRPSSNTGFVDVEVSVQMKGALRPQFLFASVSAQNEQGAVDQQDRRFLYWTNDSLKESSIEEEIKLREVATSVKWVAAANRYFLFAWINGPNTVEPRGLIQSIGPFQGRMSLVYPMSGESLKVKLRAFLGPKQLEILKQVEPTLGHAVDFGWLTVFAHPLLAIMKWFYGVAGNWGVAIILLTLLVKLLTFPLTYKSMKSMKQMSAIQPELQKIREKHKDDKEALNREMLTLMRSKGYNPVAGCLPMIIQMPVFFALYRVLYSSIELYHAPFFAWIADLSLKDPFYVTPVLLTATMFFQQKLTPNTATDPMQQKMMQWMPVIFGVFMISLPSGLSLYMLVNAVAGIVQQIFLNKKLDIRHGKAAQAGAR